jgi:hypothetical protein
MNIETKIHLNRFVPRDYQLPILDAIENKGYRKVLAILPRRAGKDMTAFQLCIRACLNKVCVIFYIFPTYAAGKKQLQVTTRLGLQVRFVDAESGQIRVGSGMGEATQYGQSFLKSLEMKFAQSTVGISTRKALETGCSRVVSKMIKDGVFSK